MSWGPGECGPLRKSFPAPNRAELPRPPDISDHIVLPQDIVAPPLHYDANRSWEVERNPEIFGKIIQRAKRQHPELNFSMSENTRRRTNGPASPPTAIPMPPSPKVS